MREIKLTQGQVALVDDEDFERVNRLKWYAEKRGNTFYARHDFTDGTKIYMHHFIMGSDPYNPEIDHIFNNGLDNRKLKLRTCTRAQNSANVPSHKDAFSKHKGVSFCPERNRWACEIMKNGVRLRKRFKTEIEAAKQYDIWSIMLHGEFGKLNFND